MNIPPRSPHASARCPQGRISRSGRPFATEAEARTRLFTDRGARRLRDPRARRHGAVPAVLVVAHQRIGRGGVEPRAAGRGVAARQRRRGAAAAEATERGTEFDGRVKWESARDAVHRARTSIPISSARPRRSPRGCTAITVRRDATSAATAASARCRSPPCASARATRHERARDDDCRGFTLIELLVALGLFAMLVEHAVRLAAPRRPQHRRRRGKGAGELRHAPCQRLPARRSSRRSIRSACARCSSSRCCSAARSDEIRYRRAAARAAWASAACGTTSCRSRTCPASSSRALVLDRVIPDLDALSMPSFDDAERSVLADDVKSIKISYYGRDRGSALDSAPTWRGQLGRHAAPARAHADRSHAAPGRAVAADRRRAARRARGGLPRVGHDPHRNAWVHDDAAAMSTMHAHARCGLAFPGRPSRRRNAASR